MSDAIPAGIEPRTPEAQIRYWRGMATRLRFEKQSLEIECANWRKKAMMKGQAVENTGRTWAHAQDGRR